VLEREDTAQRDGQRSLARLRNLDLNARQANGISDPLAPRLGRTFAAAPALLLALASLLPAEHMPVTRLTGVDGQTFSLDLEARA
jgi:hypothetical protein